MKMYALFCLFTVVGFVWMAFLYKILVNLRRDNEIKVFNQTYHNFKLKQLYGKVEETEKAGRETEKTNPETSGGSK